MKVRWFQTLEILIWLEKCVGSQRDGNTYHKREYYIVLHCNCYPLAAAKYQQGYLAGIEDGVTVQEKVWLRPGAARQRKVSTVSARPSPCPSLQQNETMTG